MRVIVKGDCTGMGEEAARIVARQIIRKPDSVLGLPTGETPIGMYAGLVRMYEGGLLDFSAITTFNLDEFLGIGPEHPGSYHRYMRKHLCDRVNVKGENAFIPNGAAADVEAESRRYEEEIAIHGGIDLQVLGIGPNGHIGFNEPGTDWGMTVGPVKLSAATRAREAERFGGLDEVPTHAITMGIKAIMSARAILLLACGREKAAAVRRALASPVTPDVPASVLQLHPNLTVVLDRSAAAGVSIDA